jgi:hypothetical protein
MLKLLVLSFCSFVSKQSGSKKSATSKATQGRKDSDSDNEDDAFVVNFSDSDENKSPPPSRKAAETKVMFPFLVYFFTLLRYRLHGWRCGKTLASHAVVPVGRVFDSRLGY